jgi:hypothetical protein
VPAADPATAWAAIRDTKDPTVLEDFIRQFGATPYGLLARARLEDLRKGTTAVVAPPATLPVASSPRGGVVASLASRSALPLTSAELCALKPKDVFKECDKCPEMVVVPEGSFKMGRPAGRRSESTVGGVESKTILVDARRPLVRRG